jgi:hypothetical protein
MFWGRGHGISSAWKPSPLSSASCSIYRLPYEIGEKRGKKYEMTLLQKGFFHRQPVCRQLYITHNLFDKLVGIAIRLEYHAT